VLAHVQRYNHDNQRIIPTFKTHEGSNPLQDIYASIGKKKKKIKRKKKSNYYYDYEVCLI